MKSKAILMALAMMTTALAGCTGTDGVTEVDEDALNELIDANLQDFINNTTIVVNNHYHNNTTLNNNHYDTTNEYNNTTNIDGGEVNNQNTDNSVNHYNGSGHGSMMQMFTVNWDFEEHLGYDPSERIVTGGSSNNQNNSSSSGTTLLYVDFYNGQVVEFRDISCEDWLNYRQFHEDDWEYWLDDNYGADWSEREDVARDIYSHFLSNDYWDDGYAAYEQCSIDNSYLGVHQYDPDSSVILYEVYLEVGQAMSYLVAESYVTVDVNCDDGYGTGLGNGTPTGYIGGQANCTVTGSTVPIWQLYKTTECKTDENGDCLSVGSRTLYEYGIDLDYTAQSSFAVYFTIHDVVVYDQGTE